MTPAAIVVQRAVVGQRAGVKYMDVVVQRDQPLFLFSVQRCSVTKLLFSVPPDSLPNVPLFWHCEIVGQRAARFVGQRAATVVFQHSQALFQHAVVGQCAAGVVGQSVPSMFRRMARVVGQHVPCVVKQSRHMVSVNTVVQHACRWSACRGWSSSAGVGQRGTVVQPCPLLVQHAGVVQQPFVGTTRRLVAVDQARRCWSTCAKRCWSVHGTLPNQK